MHLKNYMQILQDLYESLGQALRKAKILEELCCVILPVESEPRIWTPGLAGTEGSPTVRLCRGELEVPARAAGRSLSFEVFPALFFVTAGSSSVPRGCPGTPASTRYTCLAN